MIWDLKEYHRLELAVAFHDEDESWDDDEGFVRQAPTPPDSRHNSPLAVQSPRQISKIALRKSPSHVSCKLEVPNVVTRSKTTPLTSFCMLGSAGRVPVSQWITGAKRKQR